MKTIVLGVDVSKGYADIAIVNDSGTVLAESGTFDDTAEGHGLIKERILSLVKKNEGIGLVVGMEASGGLERNWLQFFFQLKSSYPITVLRLNPMAVRKYFERNLRRSRTDKLSARSIADYLMTGRRRQDVESAPELEGPRTLYRCINAAIGRRVQTQTELQALLPSVHPELVQFCRDGLPNWILELLTAYPTAARLSKAREKSLCKINQITPKRATRLIEAARHSVASLGDRYTAETITFLASQIKEQNEKIVSLKNRLLTSLKDDPAVKIIDSIKGIALWTAVVLRLEYGYIERFYSADAAVAFAGLDPRIDQSGDSLQHCGISRAGRKQIRTALYMPTLAAIRSNSIIRAHYLRLIAAGKPEKVAITACMRKMVRLVYGCWITDRPFDPNYHPKPKAQHKAQGTQSVAIISASLDAPISRREAKRRKAAAAPQNGINHLMRGPGAALNNDKSSSSKNA